jgi:hypothetical protein
MNQRAAWALGFLVLVGASCPFGPEEGTHEINGIVYASVSLGADAVPRGTNPIGGATVSTSLNGQTAVTDASGYFELKSDARPDQCEMYTITINATGYPLYSITRPWGLHARDQLFGISGHPFPDDTNLQCG